MSQMPLIPVIAAHCFYRCGHTETGFPNRVHDAMETHYATVHDADYRRILTRIGVRI